MDNALYSESKNSQEIERKIQQMKKCICKIHSKDNNTFGIIYFCKIQLPNNLESIKVLIINNNILSKIDIENEKKIKISINDDKIYKYIEINKSRLIFTSEKYDITFIEIKEKDELKDFLELDNNINEDKNILNNIYLKKQIYTINYTDKNSICVSYGLLNEIKDNYLNIILYKKDGLSYLGSPIILSETSKLIGFIYENCENSEFIKGYFILIHFVFLFFFLLNFFDLKA